MIRYWTRFWVSVACLKTLQGPAHASKTETNKQGKYTLKNTVMRCDTVSEDGCFRAFYMRAKQKRINESDVQKCG